MLKNRDKLEESLKREIKKNSGNKTIVSNNVSKFCKDFGYDESIGYAIFTMVKSLSTCNDELLFAITKIVKNNEINYYFTPKEINEYSKKKKRNEVDLPIKWEMIQINEDHFIGTISAKDIIKLRDNQLINYNENAQRTTQKDGDTYQISINRKAIEGIKQSFLTGVYIPNTITLNIPIDDSEYFYNGNELTITKLNHFDILDGYHRYIAMSELYNLDETFDYPMELRVFSFSDEKARQFIWQEDQKTKMRKIDSDSFNQNSYANQVISLLNESPLLRGLFNIHGNIDNVLASRLLTLTFFNNNKKKSRKDILEIKKYITECFSAAADDCPELLDSKWSDKFLISFFVALYITSEPYNVLEIANKINAIDDPGNKLFRSNFTKGYLNKLYSIIKEENIYVQ